MARKSKYDEYVAPFLDDVQKWAAAGATIKEIADALGVAESTLYEYQKNNVEFSEALRRGRQKVVIDIKAALLKKALGFYYEETRNSMREDEKNGKAFATETTKRYCPPSETAAAMLLRNYDKEWQDKDTISIKFREQEQELKRRIAEANNFLGE